MSKCLKFVVFLGTTREGRLGERVAKYVVSQIQKRGHSAELFDPISIDLPLLVKPYHFYKDKSEAPSVLSELNEKIIKSDAVIVVSGEYNHSIPPALSNLMDHFPGSSYAWKPSGIVCYSPGNYGGMRAAMQLRAFLGELGCISVSNLLGFPKVHEKLDPDGEAIGDDKQMNYTQSSCANFLSQVEWWGQAAKGKRTSDANEKK